MTRECPIHTAQPPVQAVLAFELFDSPRINTRSNNTPLTVYTPQNIRAAPAKKQRHNIMDEEYGEYLTAVKSAIIKPTAWGDKNQNHKEIKYLESMLLFLTQECKSFFKALIKCEYLLEANFLE